MEEDDFINLQLKTEADTRERVSSWGAQPTQSSKLSSKKSRCPNETNTVTG